MDRVRALELMKIEAECIRRNSLPFGCDRHCEDCDLVQEDWELEEAYGYVIGILESTDV